MKFSAKVAKIEDIVRDIYGISPDNNSVKVKGDIDDDGYASVLVTIKTNNSLEQPSSQDIDRIIAESGLSDLVITFRKFKSSNYRLQWTMSTYIPYINPQ